MKRNMEINGLKVEAEYSRKAVEEIFIPLLEEWTRLQREAGRRIVVFLAAPPATGKSTLAAFLKELSELGGGLLPITTVGMDGFHRRQEYLLSHTIIRDGRELPMTYIKGAPVTFDLEALAERIERVRTEAVCPWPEYNRKLHDPVDNAVQITGDIVLIEGNYLLLDEDGWRELRKQADYTVRILAEEKDLRERLVWRRTCNGVPQEEAEYLVDTNDLPNVRLCVEKTMDGDLTLQMKADGDYQIKRGAVKKG